MKLEERKKSDIFAARKVRAAESVEGTAYKKKYESDAYVSAGKKKNKKKKKLSDASNFFSGASLPEGDRRRGGDDRRGRGRGKGKKSERKPRQPKINLKNMNEFPSL